MVIELTPPEEYDPVINATNSVEVDLDELKGFRLTLAKENLSKPSPVVELGSISNEELDDLWSDYKSKRSVWELPPYPFEGPDRRVAVEEHDLVICKPNFVIGEDHVTYYFKVVQGLVGSQTVYSKTVEDKMGGPLIWKTIVQNRAINKATREYNRQRQRDRKLPLSREVVQLSTDL